MRVGRELCLDFCNTRSFRNGPDPGEWLGSYRDLLAWCWLTHCLAGAQIEHLVRETDAHPRKASAAYEEAIVLRESLYKLFSALADGREVDDADLGVLNGVLDHAYDRAAVTASSNGFTLIYQPQPVLVQPSWAVARSAAELLTSERLDFLKECPGKGCGWLFIDTSRNRSRRWCMMEVCGNRARVRAYLERQRGHN